MKLIKYFILLIIAFVILVILSVYKVDDGNVAIIIQFGQIAGKQETPGLHLKLPFQTVHYYSISIHQHETDEFSVKTKDKKESTAFFEKMVEKRPFLKKRVVVPNILEFFLEAARWLDENKKSDHALQLLAYIKEQYPMEKYRDYSAAVKKLKIVAQKLKELQK